MEILDWHNNAHFEIIANQSDYFYDPDNTQQILFNYCSSDDYLEGMMNEAPGAINFTMFLTLFGERLQGTDPEDVIKNAFGKKIHFFYFSGMISLKTLFNVKGSRACANEIHVPWVTFSLEITFKIKFLSSYAI